MTGRSVPEWIGATPDTQAPDRVRVRVFELYHGKCHRCTRKIGVGEGWTLEHMTALVNGGENRESNLNITCDWCLPQKNREDIAIKARSYRIKKRHLGVKPKGRPIPGSKRSGFRRGVGGTVTKRNMEK